MRQRQESQGLTGYDAERLKGNERREKEKMKETQRRAEQEGKARGKDGGSCHWGRQWWSVIKCIYPMLTLHFQHIIFS